MEHSAKIFIDHGYEVFFWGTKALAAMQLAVVDHPRIRVKLMSYCPPGIMQKLHFFLFCIGSIGLVLWLQPRWIYLSDPMSAPVGWVLSLLSARGLIYHEHDSPSIEGYELNRFDQILLWARNQLGKNAGHCILPNQERLNCFIKTTRRTGPADCVWNCPSRGEVIENRFEIGHIPPLILYYHGSITPERLPLKVIEAMSRMHGQVHLCIVGYETIGSSGYAPRILQFAKERNLEDNVRILAAVARENLYLNMHGAHVGLSLMPKISSSINMKHMAGASNKPFDYMAGSLALLVSNLPEWEGMYVKTGYGLSCDPDSVDSIAQCLKWFRDNPWETQKMGELGVGKIRSEWNYEEQFKAVMDNLQDIDDL